MQEILRTNSLTQALTLQTALQAAGIEAALRDEHTLGIAGGGVSVVVLDDRATDRARAILLEIDSLPESRPILNKPLAAIVREYQRRWVQQLWVTIIAVVYFGAVVITSGISIPVRAALVIGAQSSWLSREHGIGAAPIAIVLSGAPCGRRGAHPAECPSRVTVGRLPNMCLKLAGGDRSKGSGVFAPWRAPSNVHYSCARGRVARSLSAIR